MALLSRKESCKKMKFRIFLDGNEVYSTNDKGDADAIILYVFNMKDQKYRLVRDSYDHVSQEKHWYFETR
nr:MAG: hypothetical protein [Bacteriophage sp.]